MINCTCRIHFEELEENVSKANGIRRGCERGASIVVSFDTKVVLQMPRGNIEIVEPRALLFDKLGKVLESEKIDWKLAFKMCRRQRVNLNLLVDHSGIDEFSTRDFYTALLPDFRDKNAVAAFNTFLFELEEQNCTLIGGLYSEVYHRDTPPSEKNKVTCVCSDLCQIMEEDELSPHILSIYLHALLKLKGRGDL